MRSTATRMNPDGRAAENGTSIRLSAVHAPPGRCRDDQAVATAISRGFTPAWNSVFQMRSISSAPFSP